jgi:molybdate transport repressor ModE-like protein
MHCLFPLYTESLKRPYTEQIRFICIFGAEMAGTHISIRIDLASGDHIGPGKIALLEAVRSTGSISWAARSLGMSYRRAWLLVEEINNSLREPAVTAEKGGHHGGRAVVTSAQWNAFRSASAMSALPPKALVCAIEMSTKGQ